MDILEINTAIQISKQVSEVFEAVLDPSKMSNYFIAEGSGRLAEGEKVTWKFPEFDEKVNVEVVRVVEQEYISWQWEGAKGEKTLVEITFLEMPESTTLVKVTEGLMKNNEKGVKWLAQNTEGWANFLASLKAYAEYGVNLRKGAFEFLKASKR